MGKRLTNDWPHYKDRVTVADVLESGACLSGVIGFVEKKGIIAGETRKFPNNEFIQQAANALSLTAVGYGVGNYGDSGYGSGYGGGYGGGSGCYGDSGYGEDGYGGGYGDNGYGSDGYGDGSDGNGGIGYGDSVYGGKL